MLSLEQIKRLESRVYKAVELIKALKEDNSILKSELKSANERVEELEQIISDYRNNQLEIEQGIVKAIKQLDDIDSITDNLEADEPDISGIIDSETELDEEEFSKTVTNEHSGSIVDNTPTSVSETESEEKSQQLDIF